ncbi:ubiquinone/menaquinone biosynthesis methyltransferase family protein [Nitzschia inconspicua]|uniref:2-methoxy-6-polyprenyl-1,4-benzoquinol methylase, mitochondrial n=1 Tax=Nitzschia inconspicua TaxID=303405 RepID=A0A9K3LSV2_9STRA|nr:ubiquinone/menaquinone biosynthesis methyltransferase family protein [Nitzschia inconspicua]
MVARQIFLGNNNFGCRRLVQKQRLFSTNAAAVATANPTTTTASTAIDNNTKNHSKPRPETYIQGSETHFGFESVGVEEKEGRVRQVFESVADSYDVMNDLMSGGLHRYWKDTLLDMSAVESMAQAVRLRRQQQQQQNQSMDPSTNQLRILDVAGGTGDVAFRFVDAAGLSSSKQKQPWSMAGESEQTHNQPSSSISVTVCDINKEMLRVGEARARERFGNQLLEGGDNAPLSFVQGNAQSLHFPDNSFDLYTIAFGLRNVTDVDKGLEEAFRVLKPGGRFMCLEFSQVPDPILRQIYDTYSFHVIPAMGELVANDRASYQYLVESIRKFSNQQELLDRMDAVGFELTKYTNLTGGIVAIHEGWKPII